MVRHPDDISNMIVKAPLLSTEQEGTHAQTIQDSRAALLLGLLSISHTLEKIGALYKDMADGKRTIRHHVYVQGVTEDIPVEGLFDNADQSVSSPKSQKQRGTVKAQRKAAGDIAAECLEILALQSNSKQASDLCRKRQTLAANIMSGLRLNDAALDNIAAELIALTKQKTPTLTDAAPQRERTSLSEHQGIVALIRKNKKVLLTTKQEMIEANLRLVISIARKYKDLGMSLQDLVQEGNTGLMRAVEGHRINSGKFSSYAGAWIDAKIKKALDTVRLPIMGPQETQQAIARMGYHQDRFFSTHGRSPNDNELAQEMGMSVAQVKDIIKKTPPKVVSVDQPLRGAARETLISRIADPSALNPSDVLVEKAGEGLIAAVLETLKSEHGDVLRLRFGIGREYALEPEEIAEQLGCHPETVRQREKRALLLFSKAAEKLGLRDVLAPEREGQWPENAAQIPTRKYVPKVSADEAVI